MVEFMSNSEENYVAQMIKDYVLKSANQNTPAALNLYDQVIEHIERPLIQCALEHCRGNRIRAAKLLGINRNTLYKKIKNLNIPTGKKKNGVI